MPSALALYEIPCVNIAEAEEILDNTDYSYFTRKDSGKFFELAVTYELNNTKRLEEDRDALEVHLRIKELQKEIVTFDVHNLFSFFEILNLAQESKISILSFSERDHDSYSVKAIGLPRRLNAFKKAFESFSKEEPEHERS
jgi:hypothetical protein